MNTPSILFAVLSFVSGAVITALIARSRARGACRGGRGIAPAIFAVANRALIVQGARVARSGIGS